MTTKLTTMASTEETRSDASGSRSRLEGAKVARRDEEASLSSSEHPVHPSHLFWVPASMHPEISPSDFRRFLEDHASRAVREHQETPSASTDEDVNRQTSVEGSLTLPVEALKKRSTSIARRGSTLRRQYRPENDDENAESLLPEGRSKAFRTIRQRPDYRADVPQLSNEDVQKLERLAEEASKSNDPLELRSVLRRTMSLNVSPSALDQVDALPTENEQDAPLIVPRPGQILRRAARTKIRKSSFSTDDGSSSANFTAGSRRRRGPTDNLVRGASLGGAPAMYAEGAEREAVTLYDRGPVPGQYGESHSRPQSAETSESTPLKTSRESYTSDDTQRTSITSSAESVASASSWRDASQEHVATSPLTPTQRDAHLKESKVLADGDLDYFRGAKGGESVAYGNGSLAASQGAEKGGFVAGPLPETEGERSRISTSSSEVPFSTSSKSATSVKPIVVQQVSPAPAFEKTRPAPQPPVQHDEALSSSIEPAKTSLPSDADGAARSMTTGTPNSFSAHRTVARADTMPNLGNSGGVSTVQGKPAKEKKSAFGLQWLASWTKDDDGSEKASKKKGKRERDFADYNFVGAEGGAGSMATYVEKEREKDSPGFLGALFGKRKGHEEVQRQEYNSQMYGAATGAASVTAGSLLDMHSRAAGQLFHHRYPIHIERAVYRLSHIKLANPRRPLYEQVLISNLMFWYLSVINQPQQQQKQQPQQLAQQHSSPSPQAQHNAHPNSNYALQEEEAERAFISVNENVENDRFEADEQESFDKSAAPNKASHVTALSPPADADSMQLRRDASEKLGIDLTGTTASTNGHRQPLQHSSNSSANVTTTSRSGGGSGTASSQPKARRGGLVKPNRAPPGSRSAERAIPAAAYSAQHRQINSEMAQTALQHPQSDLNAAGDRASRSNANSASVRNPVRTVSPTSAATSDEHAWLQNQRASSGSEEWKSNGEYLGSTTMRVSGHRSQDVDQVRTDNWSSDELSAPSDNRQSTHAPRNIEATMSDDHRRWPKGEANLTTYSNGGGRRSDVKADAISAVESDKRRATSLSDNSLIVNDADLILSSNSKEANAMLDAARQSQSRRR